MEEHIIYGYSLCAALSLMLFFGLYLIFGRTPDRPIFKNYKRSRRIIGTALIVLSANYAVHMFVGIRFVNNYAAILMNLSTYFLCYWLFSSALRSLLDRNYITRKRNIINLSLWILFTFISFGILLMPEGSTNQKIFIIIMAIWLLIYGLRLATNLIIQYHHSVKLLDNSHSDDIEAYIHWLSITTYWALIYGVGCSMLTFLPDKYVIIWILSSIPFYVYLYCSYMNYLLFYEQVEQILEMATKEAVKDTETSDKSIPTFHSKMEKDIDRWVSSNSFIKQGLTIEDMAKEMKTNRTYLSEYINSTFGMSFREWVTYLRLEYSKKMLLEHKDLTIAAVAEMSGFLSLSYYTKVFTDKENISPARWRKIYEE